MDTQLIERMKAAIEGECNGLAIDDAHAAAIVEYVLDGYLARIDAERGKGAVANERGAFERWARPDAIQMHKNECGDYTERGMQAAFNGWLARARIYTTIPEGWQSIETAPQTGRTILLGYFNQLGNWRTLRGQWFSRQTIQDEWEDGEDCEEGWYETSVEADDMPNCWPTSPTHWMPLPTPPIAQGERNAD